MPPKKRLPSTKDPELDPDQQEILRQNSDLKLTIEKLLAKLDQLLGENIKLQEQNSALTERIDILENLLKNRPDRNPPLQ